MVYTIFDRRHDVAILQAHITVLESQLLAADKTMLDLKKHINSMEESVMADLEAEKTA